MLVQFILILFASILGSLHCAAMCGGFAAMCGQRSKTITSQCAYHLGRLISYLILGVIAGIIGIAVNKIGQQYGINSLAGYIVASLLIIAGFSSLFALKFDLLKHLPYQLILPLKNKISLLKDYSFIYPLMIGFFSAFLPCAWLYSYVAVAVDAPNLISSFLVMFFFWLGTLPILISIGSLSKLITSPLKKYAPTIIALIMIFAGTYSLYQHINSTKSHCACSTSHHNQ